MQSIEPCLWFATTTVELSQSYRTYGGMVMKIHDFHRSYIINNKTLVCPVPNTANLSPSCVFVSYSMCENLRSSRLRLQLKRQFLPWGTCAR